MATPAALIIDTVCPKEKIRMENRRLAMEAELDRMCKIDPMLDSEAMCAQGYEVVASLNDKQNRISYHWGFRVGDELLPVKTSSKNKAGIPITSPVPVHVIYVGPGTNTQLSSSGNVRAPHMPDPSPEELRNIEDFYPVDFLNGENIQCLKVKQALDIVAGPLDTTQRMNNHQRHVILHIAGKEGLIAKATATLFSQPENKHLLKLHFDNVYQKVDKLKDEAYKRLVYDEVCRALADKNNGYHLAMTTRQDCVKMPINQGMVAMYPLKKKNNVAVMPDNSAFTNDIRDPTGVIRNMLEAAPTATFQYLKKLDNQGVEIVDDTVLRNLNNPDISAVLSFSAYFLKEHVKVAVETKCVGSVLRIIDPGDEFTKEQLATVSEWKRASAATRKRKISEEGEVEVE